MHVITNFNLWKLAFDWVLNALYLTFYVRSSCSNFLQAIDGFAPTSTIISALHAKILTEL